MTEYKNEIHKMKTDGHDRHFVRKCLPLLTSGKLNSYLADIDKRTKEKFSRTVNRSTERDDLTGQLEWVRKMANIRNTGLWSA